MDGAQVFSCGAANNIMSRFSKNEGLFLKVENDRVSGKGYVCNEDGKNGYVDDFAFSITEVKNIFIGEYMGAEALGFNARVSNIYGAKKVQIMLPQLKNMNLVLSLLKRLKSGAENKDEDIKTVQAQPAAAPTAATANIPPVSNAQPTYQQPVAEAKPAEPEVAQVSQVAADDDQMSTEEFNKRMEKLVVLKDCGLLGEKEFNAKKIELVSQFCDLTEFNEKIQKLIVLKDCGLLSDKEFEANRVDIIKECCDTTTNDMKEYRKSIQKMSFLEMGGVITAEEYEKNKQMLIEDVAFSLSDDKDEFAKKLKKLPVLKECQLISEREYKQKVDDMFKLIEVSADDELEHLAEKLNKWPLLAQERYISVNELSERQKSLIEKYLNSNWSTPEELEKNIKKMVALKQGDWLTDMEYYSRREDLLREIDAMEDYSTKIQIYMMLPKTGFVSEEDYLNQKQKCIDDIFKNSGSMDEFKVRVNNLLELQKVGMITESEFVSFKTKLMSEL